jgi:hypothetical protein
MELFVPGTPDKVKKVSYDMQKELNTHTTFVLLIEKKQLTQLNTVVTMLQPTISVHFKMVCDTALFKSRV